MNIFKKFKSTTTTFGELDYGEFFSHDNNKDIIYLKVFDVSSANDLAIVIDDPYEETDGICYAYQYPKDMEVDQVYSADLYLYD